MTNPEAFPAPQDPQSDDQPKRHVEVELADDEETVEASLTDSDTKSLPGDSVCSHNSTRIPDTDIHTGATTGAKPRLPGGALTSIQRLPVTSNGSSLSIEIVRRSQVDVASY
ncbi:hypothetical protein M378DRAFT_166097, partial [Amanita muscaria Koide BX008]